MVPSGLRRDCSTIGWAVLGVRPVDLVVRYVEPPSVQSVGGERVELHLDDTHYTVLAPYFTEVTVAEPLTREAFRDVADQYPVASELIRALESGRH